MFRSSQRVLADSWKVPPTREEVETLVTQGFKVELNLLYLREDNDEALREANAVVDMLWEVIEAVGAKDTLPIVDIYYREEHYLGYRHMQVRTP